MLLDVIGLLILIGSSSFKKFEYFQPGSRNGSRSNGNRTQLIKERSLIDVLGDIRLVIHTPINNRNDCVDFGEGLGIHGSCNVFSAHPEGEILGILFSRKERWKLTLD